MTLPNMVFVCPTPKGLYPHYPGDLMSEKHHLVAILLLVETVPKVLLRKVESSPLLCKSGRAAPKCACEI